MSPETQILRTAAEVQRILERATRDLARQVWRYRKKHGMVSEFQKVKLMLRKQLNEIRADMQENIVKAIESGQANMWDIANRANDIQVKNYLKGKKVPGPLMESMNQANLHALDAFMKRKSGGLGLSGKVWRMSQKMMGRVETYLGAGITTGKSAARMATDLKKYLNKPNALFRRVRDAKGILRLSKKAREYHPGRGVYRSAFKNAHRLARTEVNMAYRQADFERRQQMPFVTGVEVHANDDACDMCIAMKGDYPKEFVFDGFHPQCRCWTTDKMIDDKEFSKYLDTGHVDQRLYNRSIPQKAQGWIEHNKARLLKTKAKLEKDGGYSYWMSNFDKQMHIKPEIGVHAVAEPVSGFIPAKTNEEIMQRFNNIGMTNVELSTNNASNQAMLSTFEQLNRDGFNVKGFRLGGGESKAYAGWNPVTEKLAYNHEYFNNNKVLLEKLAKDVSKEFHPRGCDTIKSVLEHEYAHSLTNEFKMKKGFTSKFQKIQSDYFTEWDRLKKDLINATPGSSAHKKALDGMMEMKISNYAKDSLDEFIAEGFSMYRNAEDASPFAIRIGELIREMIK